MKQTKLSAGSNLLWEGSRMMLPEHKEALISNDKRIVKKTKPNLDEQKLDEISNIIVDSYQNNIVIKVTIFDEYENEHCIGVVTHIDPHFKSLKLQYGQTSFKVDSLSIINVSYDTEF